MKLTKTNIPQFNLELNDEEASWLMNAVSRTASSIRGDGIGAKREYDFLLVLSDKLADRNINQH